MARNRYIQISVFCWLLSLPVFLVAGEAEDLLQQANDAYANGEYQRATDLYQGIVDMGYESVDLYYNLGNAAYKDNQLAKAILNYEKALKLEPGQEDATFNLRLANMRLVDKVEVEPEFLIASWWNGLLNGRSSGTWGGWALAFLWLALVAGVVFLFVNRKAIKRITFFGGIALVIFSLVSLGMGLQKRNLEQNSKSGIIMSANAYVKSAPDLTSTDLFILHEGLKVNILEIQNDWVRVSLADGKLGWLQATQIAEI